MLRRSPSGVPATAARRSGGSSGFYGMNQIPAKKKRGRFLRDKSALGLSETASRRSIFNAMLPRYWACVRAETTLPSHSFRTLLPLMVAH